MRAATATCAASASATIGHGLGTVVDKSQLNIEVGEARVFLQAPKEQIDATGVAVEGIREKLAGGED
jgi:hypothetical protein